MTTAPAHPPRRTPAPTGGAWYIALALLSWGTLAPVAFLHAAARQRTRAAVVRAAAYTAAVPMAYVLGWAGLGGSGTVVLLVGIMIVALVHLGRIRREIWPPGPRFPVRLGIPGPGQDPAVAAALAGRARREESRRIIEVRQAAGVPFTAVEDVFAWAEVPLDLWELVRDRGIVY
jgi:hypothetical protein